MSFIEQTSSIRSLNTELTVLRKQLNIQYVIKWNIILTQKMKLKKNSMYLINLVQPSTPMVNVRQTASERNSEGRQRR